LTFISYLFDEWTTPSAIHTEMLFYPFVPVPSR
jgi:hypothetical protein